jgi:predicted RecA/RadA family phage recombinase
VRIHSNKGDRTKKNFIHGGDIITIAAPAGGVISGQGVPIGNLSV